MVLLVTIPVLFCRGAIIENTIQLDRNPNVLSLHPQRNRQRRLPMRLCFLTGTICLGGSRLHGRWRMDMWRLEKGIWYRNTLLAIANCILSFAYRKGMKPRCLIEATAALF